jgi:5-methyltetrahydrofolate--homocysteine methyltransferase
MTGKTPTYTPRLNPETFEDLLSERVLVFDGAMGTRIQDANPAPEDFGGEALDGCNENLSVTRPELIRMIHSGYLEAGADVIETNTFGGAPLVLGEYGLADQALEINRAAARLARDAAAEFDDGGRPRYVAGTMGPTTRAITVTGGITFDELVEHYAVQAQGLVEGGVDLLLLETVQDTLNAKAGLVAIRRVLDQQGIHVPVLVSCTIEPMGTTLAGQSVEAIFTSLEHARLSALGLNCATGPEFMTDHLRALSALSDLPTSVIPNAGLPDEDGSYHQSPEQMASVIGRFIEQGWVNIVGGCCGTREEHIRLLSELASGARPRVPGNRIPAAVSGVDYLPLDDYTPVIVGERTNVIGSRAFRQLIQDGDMDGASEIGRNQVRQGAHILDVCLADPDRDESTDMAAFLDSLIRKVRVPLMIDTTESHVLEVGLKRSQGKAIVNSINLEDGEERFAQVAPLLKKYGAAAIVGCIDEDPDVGMARTRDRKLEIALRSHELLTGKYGIPERDLIFDPLVFPVGTGDRAYVEAAGETIEGVKAIKAALPHARTILGISNVSFGLPPAGREVLNAVFLHLNLQNGLDMAIVNSERLLRATQIDSEEQRLCEDLVFNRGDDPLGAFVGHFRDRTREAKVAPASDLPLEERLARYIIEGFRDGLEKDLDEALRSQRPLEIINGPLMDGMAEVGRLFNNNELIVAEVLQSAEAMKAAVRHLEPRMEQSETGGRGTVLLATVKGDVHDIGKNLVDIILTNNGYRVINLGIKIPPGQLVQAALDHTPDLIGLSGLLVKSAQQMIVTAEELREAGITVPLLVGGAALSRSFTESRIAPAYGAPTGYARDAMAGLALAEGLTDPARREETVRSLAERTPAAADTAAGDIPEAADATDRVTAQLPPGGGLDHSFELPNPPDLKPHVLDEQLVDLDELFGYINPTMLYGKHLGLKGRLQEQLERGDEKAVALHNQIQKLQHDTVAQSLLRPRAVYRFFRAVGEGNDLVLLDPAARREEGRFNFLRQRGEPFRCLSDFVRPLEQGEPDSVALFVVTAGHGVMDQAREWKEEGAYLRSHAFQALALETAEAFAEWLHQRLREMWGFSDPPELTMAERFKAKYQGVRVSFGYPACPRLEDQEQLFRLLDVESRIGVSLTEGYMMDPEASVSALVFHHPQAEYFSVE